VPESAPLARRMCRWCPELPRWGAEFPLLPREAGYRGDLVSLYGHFGLSVETNMPEMTMDLPHWAQSDPKRKLCFHANAQAAGSGH